jgi:cyanophycinase
MKKNGKSRLLIIGGHEDKTNEQVILKKLVQELNGKKLIISTIATNDPGKSWEEYAKIFRNLGVKNVEHLEMKRRMEAKSEVNAKMVKGAGGIFFTGGDQLRFTSEFGGTPVCSAVQEFYESGGFIAGTSAGASVMSDSMIVAGSNAASPKIEDLARMSPGLGLIHYMIIDQHFAQRGRMGRLLAAVGMNPKFLGIGIDENTSIFVVGDKCLEVIGEGAVYIVDGDGITSTNFAEQTPDHTMSILDLKVHVLSEGDFFDLRNRRPIKPTTGHKKAA